MKSLFIRKYINFKINIITKEYNYYNIFRDE